MVPVIVKVEGSVAVPIKSFCTVQYWAAGVASPELCSAISFDRTALLAETLRNRAGDRQC